MLQIPIPEEMREELYQEIIQKCGYLKRGLLSEIVIDSIKEHLNTKEKKKEDKSS